jgi:hypothetical protein
VAGLFDWAVAVEEAAAGVQQRPRWVGMHGVDGGVAKGRMVLTHSTRLKRLAVLQATGGIASGMWFKSPKATTLFVSERGDIEYIPYGKRGCGSKNLTHQGLQE